MIHSCLVCVCLYVCTSISIWCMCIYIYVCLCICICICMYVCIYIYVCVWPLALLFILHHMYQFGSVARGLKRLSHTIQSTAPHKPSRSSLAMFISNSLWANAASSAARLGSWKQLPLGEDGYQPFMVILGMIYGSPGQRIIDFIGTIYIHSVWFTTLFDLYWFVMIVLLRQRIVWSTWQ
jgi:hypothetical protein